MTPLPHDDALDDDDVTDLEPRDLDAALTELRQIDKDTTALILFLQTALDRRRGAWPPSPKLN
jgi:hypothetical protein